MGGLNKEDEKVLMLVGKIGGINKSIANITEDKKQLSSFSASHPHINRKVILKREGLVDYQLHISIEELSDLMQLLIDSLEQERLEEIRKLKTGERYGLQ